MLKRIVALSTLSLWPMIGLAQDVRLVSDNDVDTLDDASLLLSLEDEDASSLQDYVAAARADYKRLLTALYSVGYYGGVISITIDGREAAGIAPLDAPQQIDEIVINVQTGPRFRFGEASVGPLAPGTEISEEFASGRTARSSRIEAAVSTARTAWRDAGHAKVSTANQQIVARHDDRRLDAVVILEPGPQLTFGPMTIQGNEDVRTERVMAIAGLPVGEVYSPNEIDKAEERLRDTGAFDSAAITEADLYTSDYALPTTLQIAERIPRRFGFGLEVSANEGLTVSSFWLHRNFLGGAEQLRIDAEASGIGGDTGGNDYSLGASFTRPATFGPDTDFTINAEISREDEPEYLLDQVSLEFGISTLITEDLTLDAGIGILRAREETEIEEREYTLLYLPVEATLEKRNEPTNATRGYYLNASAIPFASIDGELSGAQLYSDNRAYVSFDENDRFTFAARAQIGSVIGASVTEAPADYLFFSGGSSTVRGQSYQSLGVDDTIDGEDVTLGGTSFAGLQLETRVGVTDSIDLVGFYDVGYVGASEVPLEDGDWHDGAGFGLRYNTAVGPIRLDIATPASGDDAGESVEVYIGIGQAF